MKTEVKNKTIEYKIYIATDGKEFDNYERCVKYERKLHDLKIVYVLEAFENANRYKPELIGIFDTADKADEVLKDLNDNRFRVREVFVNDMVYRS